MNPKRSLYAFCLCFFLTVGLSWEAGAFSEGDLEKLKALGSCPSCDLSKANLVEANLEGANLVEAKLEGANLIGANLVEAKLEGANLTGANLRFAMLTSVNLAGANLSQAKLTGANLTGTVFCVTLMPDGTKNNSGC